MESVSVEFKINKDVTLSLNVNFKHNIFNISAKENVVDFIAVGAIVADGLIDDRNKTLRFTNVLRELYFFEEALLKLVTKEYKKYLKSNK